MVALLQIEFHPLLFSSQEESILGISKAFLDDPEGSRNEPKREPRPQSDANKLWVLLELLELGKGFIKCCKETLHMSVMVSRV